MRLKYIDVIAGLLIVRMILGHLFQCCLLTDTGMYKWINTVFSFFMPWFFFKSGMLFSSLKDGILAGSIKKMRSILTPWLWFSLISIVFASIILLIEGDISIIHHFIVPLKDLIAYGAVSTNLPLWFLLTLFIVYVLNIFITQYKINRIVVIIAGGSLAALLEYIGFKYPATISSTLLGLSFYQLGYLLKNIQFDKRFVVIIAFMGVIPMFICPSIVDVCTNIKYCGNYFVWYIYSVTAIVLINNLFKGIKFYDFPILRYVGRNAISFLVTHWIVRNVLLELFEIRGYEMLVLMCVVMIIILPALNEVLNQWKFKFLIGK